MYKASVFVLVLLTLFTAGSASGQVNFFDNNQSTVFYGGGMFSGGHSRSGWTLGLGWSIKGRTDISIMYAHDSKPPTFKTGGVGVELFLLRQRSGGFPFYLSVGQTITGQESADPRSYGSSKSKATISTSYVALYYRLQVLESLHIVPGLGVGRVDVLDRPSKNVAAGTGTISITYLGRKTTYWLSITGTYAEGSDMTTVMFGVSAPS